MNEHKDAPKKAPVSGEAGYDPTKAPGYQEYPKMLPSGLVVNSKEEEDAAHKGEHKPH